MLQLIQKVLAQPVLPPIQPGDIAPPNGPFGNPMIDTPEELVLAAINRLLLPLMATLAVLYVLWSGYQFLTAGGSTEQAEKARRNLTYSIIGVILTILAYAIIAGLGGLIRGVAP